LAAPCNATASITTTSAGTALAALALELAALGSLAQFHDAARIMYRLFGSTDRQNGVLKNGGFS
jgi:hypothetical protein